MNILLIGNGFDLAHGLPTTYKDFLAFVSALSSFPDRSQRLRIDSLNVHETLKQLITKPYTSEIEEMVSLIEKNVWINYFLKRDSKLQEKWVDFEAEMLNVTSALDSISPNEDEKVLYDRYGEHLSPLLSTLREFGVTKAKLISMLYSDLLLVRDRLLNDLEKLTRCLELYLCLCMDHIEITKRLKLINENGELEGEPIEGILSFNYTNTFEKIYQHAMVETPVYCYVHGKARSENGLNLNNMVLGIDEYLDENERDTKTAFIAFKKYYQRIFKQTDYGYSDWLFEPETNLFVIGHSLSTTDKDVLRTLMLHKNVNTKIYYHNKQANAEQISNLLKLIGYKNLNDLTRGNDETRSIAFSQLL